MIPVNKIDLATANWWAGFKLQLLKNHMRLQPRKLTAAERHTWRKSPHGRGALVGYWLHIGKTKKYALHYAESGSHMSFWVGDEPVVNGRQVKGERSWECCPTDRKRPASKAPNPLDLLV